MMSKYKANPLFATLVVVMTLLLCAEAGDGPAAGGPESCSEVGDGPAAGGSESCGEVGDRPKPATVLLQQRNEKLKVEDTGMADGTRLTDGGTADLQEGILRMNKSHLADGPHAVEDESCPPGEIVLWGECEKCARDLGITAKMKGKWEKRTKFPAGCYSWKGKLFYNYNMKGQGGKKKVTAICAKTDLEQQNVYTHEQVCPSSDVIKTEADCRQKADILLVKGGFLYTSMDIMPSWETNYPAGCFKIKRTLWFNHNSNSPAKCDESECGKVICAGAN